MSCVRSYAAPLLLVLGLAVSPLGAQTRFADGVIRYEPLHTGGPAPTAPNAVTARALGAPDGASVTLGRGGLIELAFLDNVLTNGASDAADLWIYEIGPDVEDTFVAVRPTAATALLLGAGFDADGDGFFEIGKVLGSTTTIDIDAFFGGFLAGALRFDAIQLIDDRNEGDVTGPSVGADIDAVEALTSAPSSTVPEPSTVALLGGGLAALAAGTRRRVGRTA